MSGDSERGRTRVKRLYDTRYCRLEQYERIQLRVFLESAGRRDVADALADSPSCSASRMIRLIDGKETK